MLQHLSNEFETPCIRIIFNSKRFQVRQKINLYQPYKVTRIQSTTRHSVMRVMIFWVFNSSYYCILPSLSFIGDVLFQRLEK